MSARILVADDEDSLRWVLEKGLRQAGYDVVSVKDGAAAVRAVEDEAFDLVFVDVRMPGMDGLAALAKMRERRPDACVVVMTAHGTMETAIQAMQRGAYDYLTKPFDLDEVLLLAQRALEAARLTQEVARLKTGMQEVREFSALIGRHPRMQDVYKTIGRIAGSDVTVLLRGESGTGKELVARAIHHYSRRAGRPFVAVSAAAIPSTLLESEMFGHERGAFTDAKERRLGKFELAHGGTLYLDEIGDMPLELQAKVLRALQERTIERLGGQESIRIDVRILAATNRKLENEVAAGRFRADLFWRLNVIPIEMPSLCARGSDIVRLANHFLRRANARHNRNVEGFEPQMLEVMKAYGWPGNIRELENLVERMVIVKASGMLAVMDLPPAVRTPRDTATARSTTVPELPENGADLKAILEAVEQRMIGEALVRTGGNKNRAAELLGLNRTTLVEKLRRRRVSSSPA